MKWSVGTKIGAGFAMVLAIFVLVGFVSYRSATRLIEASETRERTYALLGKLADMELLASDMQSGVRGYAILKDETVLERFQVALLDTDPALQDLRKLTVDNPRHQQRLEALEPLVRSRLDFSKEVVQAIRTKGPEAGIQLIKTGKGRKLTAEIRKVIDEMQNDGEDLLKKQAEAAQGDAHNAKRTILLGTLVALVLAGLAGLFLTRAIAGPLRNLTAVAELITVGNLSGKVQVDARSDEIGMLARMFDRMIQSLQGYATAAEQIAAGDLRSALHPQSSQDVLGQAFARMTQSLQGFSSAAEKIASGDLRSTPQPQSPQDMLGQAFARMTENLRTQIQGLLEGANVLADSASEIVASTSQLASSASESAAAVSETTTTVEEVRQTVQVSGQKAKQVSDNAQKAAQSSQAGRKSTEEVGAAMNRIRQQMEAIAASMMRLSEQSQTIGQIVAMVEDLAAQSNLLAVNAAIEAAKAGEQGKGFGVVAQEVKSLAEQSRQATNQVRTILGDIQKATATAVMATEQGGKAVEAGIRQTEVAAEVIQSLSGSVLEAAQAATQIAASGQQQLVGVEQVAGAMESIKQASAQNVASAKQLETAATNLNDLGRSLKHMVERYQT